MAEEAKKTYCPGCGEDVETYTINREGVLEVRCNYCGLTLAREIFQEDINEVNCVMIAEDSALIREMLHDTLLEKKVTKKIISAVNGAEFIKMITKRFKELAPVDLIILDIQMPIMSGINAAIALRAIEDGLERDNRKIPILFFSVKRCDDTLIKVMKYCKPAQYVNKGTNDTKDQMFDRVRQVIAHLLH